MSNSEDNIDVAFSLVRMKLESQNNAHNTLESKIGILFGFVGIIAGSAIVVVEGKKELLGLNIFTIGLIGIYLVLLFLVIASQTRRFLDPPDFPTFYSKEALARPNIDLKNQAIADMQACYTSNLKIQELKSLFYNLSVWFFAGSILFLFLGILERKP